MPTSLLTNGVSLAYAHTLPGFLIPRDQLVDFVISTLVFAILGILLFGLAFWIIVKVTPFSIRKEIEEDQNMALAILIASIIIGIAMVVAAAVHG